MARALAAAGADVALHASSTRADRDSHGHRIAGPRAAARRRSAKPAGNRHARRHYVIQQLGGLDILVNNAGIIRRTDAEHHSDEDWDEVLEIDLTSAFRLCRAAGTHMLPQRRGKIINVTSLLAFQGGIRVPAYAAAKGGLAQLTKALANEWAGRGVNVNAIAPGYMRTDNTQALFDDPVRNEQITARIPAGRWGTPDDLAGACVFLASQASDYVHGHVLVVDGGWMGR